MSISSIAASANNPPRSLTDVIHNGASRCVACGLCLPHCPTYRKTKSELESPRGRLSLMLAVAIGELEPTPKLESHLSLCVMCRSCEAVCPAGVPFAEAMDATRAHIASQRRPSLWRRLQLQTITSLSRRKRASVAAGLLTFYQKSGLRFLLRLTGMLRLLNLGDADAEIPKTVQCAGLNDFYAAHGKRRGAVALFRGCIANITDAQTLRDSVTVLSRFGYDVHVPAEQGCCGALHLHDGDADTANKMMQRNVSAFPADDIDAIITTASGCAATLVEYRGEGGKRFAAKVMDISAFLSGVEWPSDLALHPLPKQVAVHDPCTLTNVQRTPQTAYTLLRRIPNASVSPLPGNNQCCGAAGVYHLEQPDMARALRQDKIDNLRRNPPNILATSNVGCAMYIAAGMREYGINVDIVHPVTLLARQLAPELT